MKKIILTMALGLPISASAQMFNFGFKTNNQQFIEDAIKGSIVCVEQKYALSDSISGDEFGRNELDYFNYVDFIGIETEKGLITYRDVMRPWDNDKDFSQYRGKYKPILKATEIRRTNTEYNITVDLPDDFVSSFETIKGLAISMDSIIQKKGLQIDSIAGPKDGWAIWITRKGNSGKIDSVAYTCIKQQIEIPDDGPNINVSLPDVENEVIGGIYVTPKVTAPGQLTFFLNGVFACIDDNWSIIFPFMKENTNQPQMLEEEKLTPIDAPNQLPRKPKFGKK